MTDDMISRQAAINAFLTELTKRERKNFLHTWSTVEVKYFVADMLEKLPPAQPGWIPTSERLPDNDRAVLVTLKWAEDDYEVAVGEYWHNSTASHGWGSFEGHVIAWHELPTPYREGEKL